MTVKESMPAAYRAVRVLGVAAFCAIALLLLRRFIGEYAAVMAGIAAGAGFGWACAELRALPPSGGLKTGHAPDNCRPDLEKMVDERVAALEASSERAKQSQKLEAVGQLAGGIAHDFNNILTAIISLGKLLEMKLERNSPLHMYASQIIASAGKAARLTQSLLAFSRKQIIDPRPVRVSDIVKGIDKLILRAAGGSVLLDVACTDEELVVMADPAQLEQVLLNLAVNARDAMPDGGSLFIGTGRFDMTEAYRGKHGFGRPGSYAVITVSDTGTGMDTKTQSKIFEPFFTTKEPGVGTGLGLSIVYGIVKQHNGYIDVRSEPGSGTTFRIYLPAVSISGGGIPYRPDEMPAGRMETVLLAEDDAAVRFSMKRILEESGYIVIEAVDGEDAVARFAEHRDAVQLLIIDVIMPGKNGKEAYDDIIRIKPGVRALFTSGHTDDIIHKKGIRDSSLNFIPKPVSPEELLREMRRLLDS